MRRPPILLLLLLFLPSPPDARAAPAPAGGEAREEPGQLLVAEPELADPNFARTVVLLLARGPEGAFGLVVNRPYGRVPAAELLRKLGQDPAGAAGQVELFYGGPVQPDLAAVLIGEDRRDGAGTAEAGGGAARPAGPGLAVTGDPEVLAAIARGTGPRRARPVLGYAGWGPGQLDRELAQGAWAVVPADPDLVLAPEPEKVWERALARRGVDL